MKIAYACEHDIIAVYQELAVCSHLDKRLQLATVIVVVLLFVLLGFLKRLVQDIWTVFEGGQDRKPAPPRIKHVDSIDSRAYNKVCQVLLQSKIEIKEKLILGSTYQTIP